MSPSQNRPAAATLVAIALIALAALSRLVPHPYNFTPIEAVALFAGAWLGNRWLAVLVPIAALLVSDLIIGFYTSALVTYACVAAIALGGRFLGRDAGALRIVGFGLAGAVLFFVVTNFVVWLAIGHPPSYPFTWDGLVACYVAAIPFFQNQLAGVAFYSLLLFGGMALGRRRFLRTEPISA
jgi:hypothetical protein